MIVEPVKSYSLSTSNFSKAFWITAFHLITFGGTLVAAYNLTSDFGLQSTLASLLWLVGYVVIWASNIKYDGGLNTTVTKLLELFAFKHVLEVFTLPEGQKVWMKFDFLGLMVPVFEANASGLLELHWSPGQASGMMGEDRDDWSVYLKVRSSEILTFHQRRFDRDLQETVHLIDDQSRLKAEKLASELQRFFLEQGVEVALVPPPEDIVSQLHERYQIHPTN